MHVSWPFPLLAYPVCSSSPLHSYPGPFPSFYPRGLETFKTGASCNVTAPVLFGVYKKGGRGGNILFIWLSEFLGLFVVFIHYANNTKGIERAGECVSVCVCVCVCESWRLSKRRGS